MKSRDSDPSASEVAEVLVSSDALEQRVAEIGSEISADYADGNLLMVGVLKGAVVFFADLLRQISVPCEVDFMAVSSYGAGTSSSGVVRIEKDIGAQLKSRHVLLVEDIVESGLTLSYLMARLAAGEPKSLQACALLTKSSRSIGDLGLRYVGFEIPDRFAVGYGLDYAERFRNLSYIASLESGASPA